MNEMGRGAISVTHHHVKKTQQTWNCQEGEEREDDESAEKVRVVRKWSWGERET